MITVTSKGSFDKTEKFLKTMQRGDVFSLLEVFAQRGTDALASATPVDTGLTASSWSHRVIRRRGRFTIVWSNSNVIDGTPVAILIQYGHGTGTGGYVEGRDFINSTIQPLFDQIAEEVWKQVRNA